jgi:hypothetical protein
MEIEIPDDLAKEMKKYDKVKWNDIITQAIKGCLQDFTILDKLKEFWGVERDKKKKSK